MGLNTAHEQGAEPQAAMSEMAKLKEENSQLKTQMETVQRDYSDKAVKEIRKRFKKMKLECSDLQQKINHLSEKAKEMGCLKDMIEHANSQNRKLKQTIRDLNTQNVVLKSERESLRKKCDELGDQGGQPTQQAKTAQKRSSSDDLEIVGPVKARKTVSKEQTRVVQRKLKREPGSDTDTRHSKDHSQYNFKCRHCDRWAPKTC